MGAYRFFIDVDSFEVGQELELSHEEAHHMTRVMRVAPGDKISLTNGKRWQAQAVSLEELGRVRVLSCKKTSSSLRPICLVLSMLRPAHLDIAVEKAVELGVETILLYIADKSEVKVVSESRERRLQTLITAAIKQCGRTDRPSLQVTTSLEKAISFQEYPVLWADLRAGAVPLIEKMKEVEGGVTVCIGPESGWSKPEVKLLSEKGSAVVLHSNVLRAETAAIVACSIAGL